MTTLTPEEQLKFFNILIENSPNLVIFKDKNGRYIKINGTVEQIFGVKKENIYGKTDHELIRLYPHMKNFLSRSIETDEYSIREGEILVEMAQVKNYKGELFYFQVRKIPIFNLKGKIKGIVTFGKDITELINYKNYLELKNNFLSQAEHIAKIGSWYWEVNSEYVEISEEFKNLIFATKETKLKFHDFIKVFPKDEKAFLVKKLKSVKNRTQFDAVQRFFKKNKRDYRHVIRFFPRKDNPYFIGIIQDISEQKYMSYKIQLLNMIFEKANEGIVITDEKANIIDVNPAFTKITGYPKEEVIGENPRILKSNKHPKEFYENMWESILKKGFWEGEIWNRRKNGEVYPEILRIQTAKNEKGQITNYISIFYDLTKQKKLEEEHFFYRFFDPLTGLMNRGFFINKIRDEIESSNYSKFCVIVMDIDNFKQINEVLSYKTGDNILKKITEILIGLLNKRNIARIGEDSFAIIYNFNNILEIDKLIQKIKKDFNNIALKDIKLDLTCCFGISIYPDDSKNPEDLLRFAETALQSARQMGFNKYAYFNIEVLTNSRKKIIKFEKLKDAVENNMFVPFYQPKIHTNTEKIVGLEALARWKTPDGKILPPIEFIDLAEESDLIVDISKSIAYQVATHLKKLSQRYSNVKIPCAINLSISCLEKNGLVRVFK